MKYILSIFALIFLFNSAYSAEKIGRGSFGIFTQPQPQVDPFANVNKATTPTPAAPSRPPIVEATTTRNVEPVQQVRKRKIFWYYNENKCRLEGYYEEKEISDSFHKTNIQDCDESNPWQYDSNGRRLYRYKEDGSLEFCYLPVRQVQYQPQYQEYYQPQYQPQQQYYQPSFSPSFGGGGGVPSCRGGG